MAERRRVAAVVEWSAKKSHTRGVRLTAADSLRRWAARVKAVRNGRKALVYTLSRVRGERNTADQRRAWRVAAAAAAAAEEEAAEEAAEAEAEAAAAEAAAEAAVEAARVAETAATTREGRCDRAACNMASRSLHRTYRASIKQWRAGAVAAKVRARVLTTTLRRVAGELRLALHEAALAVGLYKLNPVVDP